MHLLDLRSKVALPQASEERVRGCRQLESQDLNHCRPQTRLSCLGSCEAVQQPCDQKTILVITGNDIPSSMSRTEVSSSK